MELVCIRPSGTQLFPIAWVELITPSGSFVIQRHHAPMIISLTHGSQLSFLLKSGKHESIMVTYGIAEVTREKVTVLLSE